MAVHSWKPILNRIHSAAEASLNSFRTGIETRAGGDRHVGQCPCGAGGAATAIAALPDTSSSFDSRTRPSHSCRRCAKQSILRRARRSSDSLLHSRFGFAASAQAGEFLPMSSKAAMPSGDAHLRWQSLCTVGQCWPSVQPCSSPDRSDVRPFRQPGIWASPWVHPRTRPAPPVRSASNYLTAMAVLFIAPERFVSNGFPKCLQNGTQPYRDRRSALHLAMVPQIRPITVFWVAT